MEQQPEDLTTEATCGQARARLHKWYAGASVGLSFLAYAMIETAFSGETVGKVVGFEVLAVCFGAFYLFAPVFTGAFAEFDGLWARKTAVLAGMIALTVPMIPLAGVTISTMWIYVAVAGAIMFPPKPAMGIAVLLTITMLLLWRFGGLELPWEMAIVLLAVTLWMIGFVRNIQLMTELRATRHQLAGAAVAAERARIGRDLHDILGHSLTAIAVKAGLAGRLITPDPAAAAQEVTDIEKLSRDALTDVRATAAGYRNVSLAGELAAARSVLQAAGVTAEMPTAVDDVSIAGRNVFGYVVREAVTNIVRHSDARHCTITLTPTSVTITDDGHAVGDPAVLSRTGSGLAGLAQRLESVGGRFDARHGPSNGFEVSATVPTSIGAHL